MSSEGRRWFDEEGDDLAREICDEALRINYATLPRQRACVRSDYFYDGNGPWALGGYGQRTAEERLAFNSLANAMDTLTAEVTQTMAKPEYSSVGGDFDFQETCRRLTWATESAFKETRIDKLTPQVVLDAGTMGLGILHFFEDRGRTTVERIYPPHLLIDDRSCVDCLPDTFFIRRFISRFRLMEIFPEHAEFLEDAQYPASEEHWLTDYRSGVHTVDDVLRVWEVWRIGQKDDYSDGFHAVAVEDRLLDYNTYEYPDPPLAFLRLREARRGFWPTPPILRAAPIQREMNKLLARRQDSMHLHGRPIVFVHRKSGTIKTQFNNRVGNVVYYDGPTPPTQYVPTSMPADTVEAIMQYERQIFEVLGISQMSAKSTKPAGIDSGEGLKVLEHSESRRFINPKRGVNFFRLDCAVQIKNSNRRLTAIDSDHEIMFEQYGAPVRVKWSSLEHDDKDVRLSLEPVGALGDTAAGKLDKLEGWVANGYISFGQMVATSDAKDVRALGDLMMSPQMVYQAMFDKMLASGEFIPPEEHLTLADGVDMCMLYLNLTWARDVPEERRQLLRDWYAAAVGIVEGQGEMMKRFKAAEAAAEAAMAPAPAMGGMPMDPATGGMPMDPAMGGPEMGLPGHMREIPLPLAGTATPAVPLPPLPTAPGEPNV